MESQIPNLITTLYSLKMSKELNSQVTFQGPPYSPQSHLPHDVLTSTPEHQACTRLSFLWAKSYDNKDWVLLSTLTTPTLYIDYRSVMGPAHLFPSMPAPAYIAMMSSLTALGNPLVATQHFLGPGVFTRTSDTEITGEFQARAHHVRFRSKEGEEGFGRGDGREVLARMTGYVVLKHFYKRDEEGKWWFAGMEPTVLFNEGDLKALFALKEGGCEEKGRL